MQLVRRVATPSSVRRPDAPRPRIEDALADPVRPAVRGEIVQLGWQDPLDDSLEDIWPGLAAEAAARRLQPQPTTPSGPWRHPPCVQEILDAKPRRARATRPKAEKAPGEPKPARARKPKAAAVETPAPAPVEASAPVEAPAPAPAPAPVRAPAPRAGLGQRRTAAKPVYEGAAIPAEIVGVPTLVSSFRASTGEAVVIDVEGERGVARGIAVWSGYAQQLVRDAAAARRPMRLAIRQPSNPRFRPAVSYAAAA
jgi:hypothetical protein